MLIKGYGYKIDAKISVKPGVTFAGDVLSNFSVVVIEHTQAGRKHLRMGVIADYSAEPFCPIFITPFFSRYL